MWIISTSKTTWIHGVTRCATQSMICFYVQIGITDIYIFRDARSLDGVNTEACEQTFKWVNKFTSVKSMNESRFFLFFTVIFDLHNLQKARKLRSVAHPMSPLRWELLGSITDFEPMLLKLKGDFLIT